MTFFIKKKKLHVIVQNTDDYNFFRTKFNLDTSKISLIKGSGVDLTIYNKNCYSKTNKRVLLPSRILKDKGVFEYFSAAKELKSEFNDWEFCIAGPSDYNSVNSIDNKVFEKWIRSGVIKWLGNSENIIEEYLKSSIVCLPSYREGMPKCLLEAASIGIPVVTTDVQGCREAVVNNVTGLIVKSRCSDSLKEGLKKLITEPQLRIKMSNNAYDFAQNNFGLDKVLNKIFYIYEKL